MPPPRFSTLASLCLPKDVVGEFINLALQPAQRHDDGLTPNSFLAGRADGQLDHAKIAFEQPQAVYMVGGFSRVSAEAFRGASPCRPEDRAWRELRR
jgi:hypothetical protein